MNMVFKYFVGCVIATFVVVLAHAKRSTSRRNFATKSHYPVYNGRELSKTLEGCTAVHINMVLRHGTRFPGAKDIKGINEMAGFVNQHFDIGNPRRYNDLILPWNNRFQNGDKLLAERGQEEMYNISKRLSARFPSLFNPSYNGEQHYFVSTSTPRTSQSASAFAFGLFEGKGNLGGSKFQPVSIMTTNLSHPLLRFFDICTKYILEVSKNKAVSLNEFYLFKNGAEMSHVRQAIASRLNISEVDAGHVQHMFLSCAYEVLIFGKGQWCSVFEDEDLDAVEYLYDIKNFWKRGYGFEINYKMSCVLLHNLTESINDAVKDAGKLSQTRAIFHFAHAETVIPLLCILGLFNTREPLRADNYHRQKDRLFRTSNMAPFSANVAVVLYSCKTDNSDSSFEVQVLVNENAVGLPCCNGKEVCPLEEFKNCFGDLKKWCDLSEICKSDADISESHTVEL